MLRFLADESFQGSILNALLRADPPIDVVRVQDVGLSGVEDPAILEWAANEGRIVLSHDVNTLIGYAFERVDRGLPMPGSVQVFKNAAIPHLVEDIQVIAYCTDERELEGQVLYVPFR